MLTELTLEKDAKKANFKQIFLELEKQEWASERFTSLSTRVADSPTNESYNRYCNVLPYDHTRVKLKHNSEEDIYINASHVRVPEANREYILAQGPLDYAIDRFWLMCQQCETTTIVMLCRCYETSREKSARYWPKQVGDVLRLNYDLEVALVDETKTKDFVVRNLILTDTNTNTSRRVQQLHYVNWPDFNVPDCPQSFLHFLQSVRNSGCFEEDVGPPVVHCSAGIGRSGTFALVDSALVISEEKDISLQSIRSLLLNMRTQRMGLIQTEEQLRFSVAAIILGHSQRNHFTTTSTNKSSANGNSSTSSAALPNDGSGQPPPPSSTAETSTGSADDASDAAAAAALAEADNIEDRVNGKRLAMKNQAAAAAAAASATAEDSHPPQAKKRKNSDS
eukprot:TRINITY_DN3857_c0_g1_i2.p1 TRINITY_DN3857_c0_g1~~TRINITY_DN3857_c0_g1_i2.p1  ORF type:complete len:394 (-),score=69.50 TRINITY_DN3857_c0_g1_i2:348-1529(-)